MVVESDSTFHAPSNQHPGKSCQPQQQLMEQATYDYIPQSGESTELLVITQPQQVGGFATPLYDQA